jgi:hypothetical protein
MYPSHELDRLAAHKARLRRKIALRRGEWVDVAAYLARPLDWLDRTIAVCRRFLPLTGFAGLPVDYILQRTGLTRIRKVSTLIRWAPVLVNLIRGFAGRGASDNPTRPQPEIPVDRRSRKLTRT